MCSIRSRKSTKGSCISSNIRTSSIPNLWAAPKFWKIRINPIDICNKNLEKSIFCMYAIKIKYNTKHNKFHFISFCSFSVCRRMELKSYRDKKSKYIKVVWKPWKIYVSEERNCYQCGSNWFKFDIPPWEFFRNSIF